MINIKKAAMAVGVLTLGISVATASNNILHTQLLHKFNLSEKYCSFKPQVKNASDNKLSDWKIDCQTPKGQFISTYHFMQLEQPYNVVMLESYLVNKYGSPLITHTQGRVLEFIFSRNKTSNEILAFMPIGGATMAVMGGYEKNLINHYPHTLMKFI
ncbi:hypothetical protein [Piscirickettsia salmonis]|uniref:hypothetical protein n=1 Tax=Piscirickettsia salmonis TaxID=1238 RepID=UPI0006BD635F|nr:hypothetical protein [Piscirickettsia salmonis]ALA26642.1 ABC transporter substrate-binding protein [Piscirickettsia salmonis]APS45855.1 hypothetical protein AVI48_15595 [Piscirickettsia salmonis]APS49262.1 hypothetical protein AVI49_16530 [Piscirickettsia salmonis]QGO82351.1 hypothetical protein Psal107_03402 [Piscirickettsia salmonis]QGP24180.1 hypothetical protein Psal158_03354 [Piscirickettsia salmonis]